MKICTSCKKELDISLFQRNKGTKDGLTSQCNVCDAAGKLLRVRAKKQKLVNLFGGACSKCGYSTSLQALQFHHTDDNKEAAISSLMRGTFETLVLEASKCVLLCANCHAEEHEIPTDSVFYGGKVRGQPIVHGTIAGYKKCKPACTECKKAWSTYYKENGSKKRL